MTNEATNFSTAKAQAYLNVKRAEISSPLKLLIEDGFDYKAFKKSVKAEQSFSPEQKSHILAAFNPERRVQMSATRPVEGISSHVKQGAHRDVPNPNIRPGSSLWSEENQSRLQADSPIYQMWQEVWQQTLEHYAAEATEYEQIMAEKGRPIMDDPTAFPAKCPPINLIDGANVINASVGINSKTLLPDANVTQGFIDKLDEGQQRAILFHEAQHSFDAVLSGKTHTRAY